MLSKPLERSSIRRCPTRRSVLIVEDDQAMAEVLSIRLNRVGFAASVAGSGQLALTLAKTDKPSVILLDLQLPDMSGLDVCQELVDDELTSDIPVIILTGMEQPDVLRRSRAAGCLYFVSKPYDPNALLILIEQAIEEAQM